MHEIAGTAGIERSNERANEVRSSALTEQIEVRVRRERHRRWRAEEKLRIVEETLRPRAVIAEVARRHDIGTSLVYSWRREMLAATMAGVVPVAVKPEAGGDRAVADPIVVGSGAPAGRVKRATGRIEVEFPNGVRVAHSPQSADILVAVITAAGQAWSKSITRRR